MWYDIWKLHDERGRLGTLAATISNQSSTHEVSVIELITFNHKGPVGHFNELSGRGQGLEEQRVSGGGQSDSLDSDSPDFCVSISVRID